MSGVALAFSESDLAASAAAYDPARFEAPIVVGHPKLDAPAYGWVRSLAFADGALDAEPHQVDPAFADLVAAGRYKKISAAFFSPDAPNNPVPGVYYLRHVGFLGATAPAVKGLRSPEFAEAEEGIVEFADWDDATVANLFRSFREWIIARFGLEEADKAIPAYEVRSLEISAMEKAEPDDAVAAAPLFSDPDHQPAKEASNVTPEQAAALEAENAQLKTQVAEAAARDKTARTAAIHVGHVAFAEGLIAAGQLLPAEQAVTVAALDHFAAQETPVEFADGDENKPLAEGFKSFLASLPKRIEFGEVATGAAAGGEKDVLDVIAFAAPADHGVDGASLATHRKARAWQASHPGCAYLDAVKAVS